MNPSNKFESEDVEYVQEFLRNYYHEEIGTLAQRFPKDQQSLTVDVSEVYRFDPDLHDDIRNSPEDFRWLFESTLQQYDLPADIDLETATVRFTGCTDPTKVDEVRKDDVDRLLTLSGQISKASAIRPVVETAAWECLRCGTVTRMPVENELRDPHECQGCERQGPFSLDYHNSEIEDHQLIRIKQPPEEATNSSHIGGELDAHIKGDLVGYADAGERADVTGIVKADQDDGDSATLSYYFEGHAINKRDDDYRDLEISDHIDEIREIVANNPFKTLAESIAPGITGGRSVDVETPWGTSPDKYWWVRLAAGIATLFGSWRRPNQDGTYQRGDSHMILMGDPSTGKSTIMNAVHEIAPRSAMESGKNASGAGLTAAAVNDDFADSQWSLEAGALVKAHNGVACIDEIDKMASQDLDRLHSALERQRLEFNKAGIDATLKCETSMLASGNPDGSRFTNYDTDQSQIDIVESLLDRFDLIYTFKDVPDKDKDAKIADSRITQSCESGLIAKNELDPEDRTTAKAEVDIETLQAWVAYARQNVRPVIRDEKVQKRMKKFYVNIRQENNDLKDEEAPVPATVRTLDGLIRIAEASARMRLSEEVEMIDVDMAIQLIRVSLNDVGYDPETGRLDSDWANGRGSWSQKERVEKIKGIVDSLETQDEPANVDEVLKLADEAGIDSDNAENTFDKLKQNGELYTPGKNKVRTS